MTSQTGAYDTIVIGGGQAGLATGYYLKRQNCDFVIFDASPRTGEAWRTRWDSLRLFSFARYNALPGMRFPAAGSSLPTKDEMADYLENYAAHFNLPVRSGVRVDSVTREGERFVVAAGGQRYEAQHVVVAMSSLQQPKIPAFASELDPGIMQVHSSAYKNPSQLRPGETLIIGAGNSGAEIATELAPICRVWMAGKSVGQIPFRTDGVAAKLILTPLLFRVIFHRLLTVDTPIGRRVRPKMLAGTAPLIRVKMGDLTKAGVQRVGRITGVRDGQPVTEDGQMLDVANIIWCTGFTPGFSWLRLPVMNGHDPIQDHGAATTVSGVYFVGQHFLYAFSSEMAQGVGRDAERVAHAIAASTQSRQSAQQAMRSAPALHRAG
jgi:putative flavoprotein involved in K+ transport